ncbi:MAG: lamin tail domain-containing protein, partial [Candidatus Subteraquimicrobiales bacterium]|nr:lamin tail domain-containing protein [Candidatus Subteraquimicrobiales bacterium]
LNSQKTKFMLKSLQTNFKLKNLIVVFLTPILLLGFFVGSAEAEWAGHLVISAVQITEGEGKTNHDFIEIYNPTLNDINLKGYRLVKRTKIGTSDTSIKSWTEDTIVKAHGWRLWASSDDKAYSLSIGADDQTTATIASDNGIAIRFGAADIGEIIDSVAWGAAENIFKESSAAPALGASESLVRKPGASGAGNGEDTNNNAGDFIIVANFIPRNSQSAGSPAIENSQAPASSPIPSSTPGSNPVASISPVSKSFPVAEAGADQEAVIGENIDFDGSDSFDPAGKKISFVWDFGDKTGAEGENVSHIYKMIGDYKVVLKVDNGENIGEDSLKVKIVTPEFSDKIILSEILPNPTGADKDGEWIELYNSGDKKINLKGWILASGAKTNGKQYIFSGDKFIETKSYLVVKRSESGLVLTNENGKVSLIWPPEKIMSEVSYGAAKEGKSYSFVNNTWQWADVPTPGKINSPKTQVPATSKEKAKTSAVVNILKKTNSGEILSGEDEPITAEVAVNSLAARSTVLQSEGSVGIEDFLDRLIAEKVDKAISKAKAGEITPQEKTLALADTSSGKENTDTNKELTCKDFCSDAEKNASIKEKDIRNNPWFWGDIVLSVLSLFLVWRYQEVRKKLKLS